MEKTVIRTEAAPAPFQGAPYNQAIRAGELIFVSGIYDRNSRRVREDRTEIIASSNPGEGSA